MGLETISVLVLGYLAPLANFITILGVLTVTFLLSRLPATIKSSYAAQANRRLLALFLLASAFGNGTRLRVPSRPSAFPRVAA